MKIPSFRYEVLHTGITKPPDFKKFGLVPALSKEGKRFRPREVNITESIQTFDKLSAHIFLRLKKWNPFNVIKDFNFEDVRYEIKKLSRRP